MITDMRYWRGEFGSQKRVQEMIRLLREFVAPVHVLFVGRLNESDRDILEGSGELSVLRVADRDEVRMSWPKRWWLSARIRAGRYTGEAVAALLARKLGVAVGGLTGKRPAVAPTLHDFAHVDRALACREWIHALKPDVVLFEHIRLGYVLDALDSSTRKRLLTVVDTHDVMFQRHVSFSRSGMFSDLDITAVAEAAQLKKFDRVLAIQKTDAATFQDMVAPTPVFLVPHPNEVEPLPQVAGDPVNVTFIGSGMASNVSAFRHFANSVWPKVHADARSRARILVYGSVCDAFAQEKLPEEFQLKGFAHDLRAVYATAAVVINPVLAGGGLKIKTVEALCYGRCLVTTTCGAEGLEDGAGSAFLMCDSDESFAAALGRAIREQRVRAEVARHAVEFAEAHFSHAVVRAQLRRALLPAASGAVTPP